MANDLVIFGKTYNDVPSIKATDTNNVVQTYIQPTGTKGITENGTGIDVTEYASVNVNVSGGSPSLQTKSKSYTPTESAQTETVTADNGYDGLDSVQISVGAISSTYVGTGITRRTSSSLIAENAKVTVPAGYYESEVSKTVDYGVVSNPTATKGTVSNNVVTVTPHVTYTTGFVYGTTKDGTGVSVSASELVSGTKNITQNGTGIDVTNYASVDVAVPTGSSKAIYKYEDLASRTANSYGATNAKVTVAKAGTYNISYVAVRGSSSGTMGTNLHIGATAGTNNQTFNKGTYGQYVSLTNQTIAANTDVVIYATSGSNSRSIYVGQLIVEEV